VPHTSTSVKRESTQADRVMVIRIALTVVGVKLRLRLTRLLLVTVANVIQLLPLRP
jgi:hypothetical protein